MKTFCLSFMITLLPWVFSHTLFADEVTDAHLAGYTNPQKEATETDSLFHVLRDIYRPEVKKKSAPSPAQTPYQRIAPPPKWSYYGTKPKVEGGRKESSVDGRYPYDQKKKPPAATPRNP